MLKAKDIRELTAEEINKKIADLKEELFNLKFQAGLGNLEKPARMNEIKRTIARMKTILTEGSYAKEKKATKKTTAKKAAPKKEATETVEEAPKAKKTTAKKTTAKKTTKVEAEASKAE